MDESFRMWHDLNDLYIISSLSWFWILNFLNTRHPSARNMSNICKSILRKKKSNKSPSKSTWKKYDHSLMWKCFLISLIMRHVWLNFTIVGSETEKYDNEVTVFYMLSKKIYPPLVLVVWLHKKGRLTLMILFFWIWFGLYFPSRRGALIPPIELDLALFSKNTRFGSLHHPPKKLCTPTAPRKGWDIYLPQLCGASF